MAERHIQVPEPSAISILQPEHVILVDEDTGKTENDSTDTTPPNFYEPKVDTGVKTDL
jgi:hypothetical protein